MELDSMLNMIQQAGDEEEEEDNYDLIMQGQEEDDDGLVMQGEEEEEEDDDGLVMQGEEEEEEEDEEGVPSIQGNLPVGVLIPPHTEPASYLHTLNLVVCPSN